jgi:flagellar biosynthesis protein FlhA
VLKLLLAERVSIRNLHLIIEAIAEIAPHVRRTEQIVERLYPTLPVLSHVEIAKGVEIRVIGSIS